MDKDSSVLRLFFQNFLSAENDSNITDVEYLNFLKILFFCFDDITIRTRIQRRLYLLEKIEKFLVDKTFREVIEAIELQSQNQTASANDVLTSPIKLKKINIVNFRGFQSNDDGKGREIEFNEKATLFFAPNGGGKSSLCEALEWTLTGDSIERSKRKMEGVSYYQNYDRSEPSFNKTKLTLIDGTSPLPSRTYDRCFLEKNRIEKFARIAIQPNAEIKEVLGELFGFSDIINFSKEFVIEFSPSDNDLKDPKRENWSLWCNWRDKKKELDRKIAESKIEEELERSKLDKITDGKSYNDQNKEYADLKTKLQKDLEDLKKDYSTEFSFDEFQEKISIFLGKITKYEECEASILHNAKDLDFENLFQAANIIFGNDYTENKCPLCDTPFDLGDQNTKVLTDPRVKTKTQLEKLKNLTTWKTEKLKLEVELKGIDFREIKDYWRKINENLNEDNWKKISGETTQNPEIKDIDFVELEKHLDSSDGQFIKMCKIAFNLDLKPIFKVSEIVSSYRSTKKDILKLVPDKEIEIQQVQEKIESLQSQNNAFLVKQQIRSRDEEELKKLTEQASNSEEFEKFLKAYQKFHKAFEEYQSSMILKESVAVDENISGFYRALNLHDNNSEIIKSISFPKNITDEFCIKYEKNDSKNCNALSILSEGHLKTLGLAALLSRAMKYRVTMLIFDDAINAIDSDHRDNLALLLSDNLTGEEGIKFFNDKWSDVKDFIDNCQLTITSHDRFFDEKMANMLRSSEQKRYVLYSGENGIDFCEICEKGVPANFESKIDYFLRPDVQDIRSAIFYCRIWLEEVCLRTAAFYHLKFKDSKIDEHSKQIKQPALEIVLEVIKDGVQRITPPTSETSAMLAVVESIINEKGNMPWFFEILNQESHNRRLDHINISNAPTSREVSDIFNRIQTVNSLIQQSTN